MPLLVNAEPVADPWVRPTRGPVEEPADLIVPWSELPEAGERRGNAGRLGVEVPCDVDVAALAPWLRRLALIVVDFPSASDGRGFSLARTLRARGYAGELRACGPLIADQHAFALACGFDAVEIPEELARRQPAAQWRRGQQEIAHGYQFGYGARSILELRHPGGPAPGRDAMAERAWAAHW